MHGGRGRGEPEACPRIGIESPQRDSLPPLSASKLRAHSLGRPRRCGRSHSGPRPMRERGRRGICGLLCRSHGLDSACNRLRATVVDGTYSPSAHHETTAEVHSYRDALWAGFLERNQLEKARPDLLVSVACCVRCIMGEWNIWPPAPRRPLMQSKQATHV